MSQPKLSVSYLKLLVTKRLQKAISMQNSLDSYLLNLVFERQSVIIDVEMFKDLREYLSNNALN